MDETAVEESTPNKEIKNIVINTLKKCEVEAKNNMLQIPLEDFEDRAVFYTGIPKITLHQIVNENKPKEHPEANTIDFNTHLIILKCLCKFYERKEVPTFRLMLKNVNEVTSINDQDAEQFKQNVLMLGIDYQTIFNDTKLLMEDPKISFERYSYLKKIRQIRQEKRNVIYYIGERIIDDNYNFNNPWKQNGQTPDICSREFILFHAVSKNGFANGLFCYSATEDDFYKWIVDILLGSLYPSSVVVLDNSPLHGTSMSKSITMFDTKSDMLKWLRKHNVPCSDTMHKSQLYELVEKHVDIKDIPRVDQVIKASGHQVLRLPTHFEALSPIDHIWHDFKRKLDTPNDLHNEILSLFAKMPINSYELYEIGVMEREDALFLIDKEMDNVLDNFLMDLKNPAGGSAME